MREPSVLSQHRTLISLGLLLASRNEPATTGQPAEGNLQQPLSCRSPMSVPYVLRTVPASLSLAPLPSGRRGTPCLLGAGGFHGWVPPSFERWKKGNVKDDGPIAAIKRRALLSEVLG